MRFETIFRVPTAWTSVSGRFAVHLFEGPVTLSHMDRMQAVGEGWMGEHGGKRVELVVIFPSKTHMSLDERTRMGRLIKHGEAHRTASATVILAEGLVGAMHRSVLTGLMMIAPAPHPAKVFGVVADAARWLCPHIAKVGAPGLKLEELNTALSAHLSDFESRPERPIFSLRPERSSSRH